MTLDEINAEWAIDNPYDASTISKALINLPFLHNKYLLKYHQEHQKLQKMRAAYKVMLSSKDSYYRGILDPDELKDLGWKPFPLKVRPSEVQKYVDNDKEVINYSLKIGEQSSVVDYLHSILDQIKWRGNHIKTLADWEIFLAGGR